MKKFLVLGIISAVILTVPFVFDQVQSLNIHQWQYWAIYDLEHPMSLIRVLTGIDG